MTESEKMLLDALQKHTNQFKELERAMDADLKNIRLLMNRALERQNERLDALEKLVSNMADSPKNLQSALESLSNEQKKTTEQLNRLIDGTNTCLSQLGIE
ncbi:hypothetical protein [Enterococcus faecium]|uniref:hypothetical protein n=2 Tax=Bacillati TaxID=1783272 RepID=UPI0034E9804C